ncbi:MAG: VCBS repeat-containing protein [Phycisphaerae bacterium]|nr:VCBS repeat-containing protein [Phycisphaerae bacterium]
MSRQARPSESSSFAVLAGAVFLAAGVSCPPRAIGLERIKYNHPGLVVDLGVGLWAWPLPMDYDGDGDLDMVVACPDKPYSGTYVFENPGGGAKMPVFKPGRRVSRGMGNVQVSYVGGKPVVLTPGFEYPAFLKKGFDERVKLPVRADFHESQGRASGEQRKYRIRANQWKYADYDGDGKTDLIVGIGDWSDYGWDNAFNSKGEWTRGPLHGHVYVLRNVGASEVPKYADAVKIEAGGKILDVYGMPSPNLEDFDGDGDLDLICGDFVDRLTYFENVGTRTSPRYAAGRPLSSGGKPIRAELCMITPVAVDWDGDGDVDLIMGEEDGRVALIEHTGKVEGGMPRFAPPRFFKQQADDVKFGALVTPVSVDWDGDGDEDLVCGNTAGYIGFIENLDGGNPPKWAAPRYLEADGKVIRIEAGPNGSIQGPCEAKWGYTTLNVADWDHDGLLDVVINSIWGKVQWYRNVGSAKSPKLAAAQPIEVEWPGKPPKPGWNWWEPKGKELVTQWRTTPVVYDLTGDGLNDLIMLDHEGYLALFERAKRDGRLVLLPPKRVFKGQGASAFDSRQVLKLKDGGPLRLNIGEAGRSGRRKLCLTDWDGDGRVDLLVNSVNVNFMRNVSGEKPALTFQDMGKVDDRILAGHTTSPTVVDWDKNGRGDLLVGAEDGHFYFLKNPKD